MHNRQGLRMNQNIYSGLYSYVSIFEQILYISVTFHLFEQFERILKFDLRYNSKICSFFILKFVILFNISN